MGEKIIGLLLQIYKGIDVVFLLLFFGFFLFLSLNLKKTMISFLGGL